MSNRIYFPGPIQNPPIVRPEGTRRFSRRSFLKTVGAASMGVGLPVFGKPKEGPPDDKGGGKTPKLPQPNRSGIEHIVVCMMENRSFDHFLGWLPGANGKQGGLVYKDAAGAKHSTYPLAPDYQGCGHPDPDHSYAGARVEFNNGRCDGWLRAGMNDIYSIGYYQKRDLAFTGNAAPGWTTCSNYFAAIMAGTYSNRIYSHAAQTDRLDNSLLPLSALPTIWDLLAEQNISSRYYFSDFPFLALWGIKYAPIARLISDFYADCAAGTLPAVSYVEPRFLLEEQGISGDDHPHSDIRNGEAFLNSVYEAVTASPNWSSTVLIITFDEWGGFFEHVPPTRAPIPPADAALGSDGLKGFRVPTIVISPLARRRNIASRVYDHTSILKMIEWRWNLPALTVRDATANNLAEVLDFSSHNLSAPRYAVPPGPFGAPCAIPTEEDLDFTDVQIALAQSFGFPAP